MEQGYLEFDGRRYLDGRSSDPSRLQWMEGSPPPDDRRVVFGKHPHLGFPQIRWSLCHSRELVPTTNVWRGEGPATPWHDAPRKADIEALAFDGLDGKRYGFEDALWNTYTDGILVLHRGRRVYERYLGLLRPHIPHSCFSITKSYVCTLAATLAHEGVLDAARRVPHYLPEMKGTAYEDATLREVMDMQIGVKYSEAYHEPDADIWDYSRAGGLIARPAGYAGPQNFYEYLVTLRKEGAHGQAFAYKTVNTEVLAWVVKRVTGIGLAQMLSDRIWSPLGCEQDAYITVDTIGVPMGGGGMSATLRDMARFGEMLRCEGSFNGRQVVPAAVVADIARGDDPGKFAKAGYVLLPGYSYRNMFWVTHNEHGAFEGRGIHGQRLYVAPGADLVVARFGSHPIAASSAHDPITVPMLLALGRMLNS